MPGAENVMLPSDTDSSNDSPKSVFSKTQDLDTTFLDKKDDNSDAPAPVSAKQVDEAINKKDAIPEFKDAILQILEMNFIQQYCDYKSGQLTFATQWPAKLDGKISLENKASTTDPLSNGFSFKLGRTDNSVSSEPGDETVSDLDSEEDFTSKASDIASGSKAKAKTSTKPEVGNVGRKKR
jgi:hypothetical protein